jgi:hypothetical protein
VTQLSFFGAGESEPGPDDLAGLLAGPGQAVVRDGLARVSVVVVEPWRGAALARALDALGLPPELAGTPAGATAVRTPFSPGLLPLVRGWHPHGRKCPPPGLVLDGSSLRWWCLAAGRRDAAGHLLRLGGSDEPAWEPVGAALARAGLPAVFLTERAGGPAYRLPGRRRGARLRELVGDPPDGVPPGDWPVG